MDWLSVTSIVFFFGNVLLHGPSTVFLLILFWSFAGVLLVFSWKSKPSRSALAETSVFSPRCSSCKDHVGHMDGPALFLPALKTTRSNLEKKSPKSMAQHIEHQCESSQNTLKQKNRSTRWSPYSPLNFGPHHLTSLLIFSLGRSPQ